MKKEKKEGLRKRREDGNKGKKCLQKIRKKIDFKKIQKDK